MAVFLGLMSRLDLDELNRVEVKRGRLRIKKSFGTAIKFWSRRSLWANVSTYGKLILVLALASGDRMYFEALIEKNRDRIRVAREFLGDIHVDYGHDHHHNSADSHQGEQDGEPQPRSNSYANTGIPTREIPLHR